MEFTTRFELQSQTTRLVDRHLLSSFTDTNGAVTLHGGSFQTTLSASKDSMSHLQTTSPKIFSLSFSRFTRRY